MGNQDIPIETATEILFDKKMFYKLIGEWNDEYNHPEHFLGIKDLIDMINMIMFKTLC